jgi:hypothetical protein
VENQPPEATTPPIPACTPAATDPATTPDDVNPIKLKIPVEAVLTAIGVVPPTAIPFQFDLRHYGILIDEIHPFFLSILLILNIIFYKL